MVWKALINQPYMAGVFANIIFFCSPFIIKAEEPLWSIRNSGKGIICSKINTAKVNGPPFCFSVVENVSRTRTVEVDGKIPSFTLTLGLPRINAWFPLVRADDLPTERVRNAEILLASFSDANAKDISNLLNRSEITFADLGGLDVDWTTLATSDGFKNLRVLLINDTDISDSIDEILTQSRKIEVLSLAGSNANLTKISSVLADHRVRTLFLCRLERSTGKLALCFPATETLDLSYCDLKGETVVQLPLLENLYLVGAKLDEKTLQSFLSQPRLKRIYIAGCEISGATADLDSGFTRGHVDVLQRIEAVEEFIPSDVSWVRSVLY